MLSFARSRRRLLAWVMVVLVTCFGFIVVRQDARERCEQDNEFRTEVLPHALDEMSILLGRELEAPPDRIHSFREDLARTLADKFPSHDCGGWL